ncbi:MAG TPA: AraC family transcriptional regulator [Pyrinomonadaceae bacterium]|jgi:AraC family transcriptional regulator|nr:AraC family transcriptional regulator [Pyrinomonadaceae bacterium]
MNALPNLNAPEEHQATPLVFERQARWDGITLAHYRFRAGDVPEHSHRQHLVLVNLTKDSKGEIRTSSGFNARAPVSGGVCVIPSGQPFAATLEGEAEFLAVYLDPSLVQRAAAEDAHASPGGVVEVIEKSSVNDPLVAQIGQALLAELEADAPGGRLYAESLANVLAVHLLRHYTAAGGDMRRFVGGLSGQRLRRVLAFVADNYERDLSLDDLAGEAGMSTFHFAREFKRATGTTPHQHLIKFRVEHAKTLLAEGEMPLAEVGLRSGFSHQSHFTRLFRKLTGTTPQSYRLLIQPSARRAVSDMPT